MLEWLEATQLARAIAQSLMLTASLSAVHMLGFTLVTGGALLANLRLLGVLFPRRSAAEVTEPATLGIALGLAISVVTGLLLFAGRASRVIESDAFQLKMLLLLAAASFHFTWHRRVARRASAGRGVLRATGAVGLSLWLGLAAAACAFILFE